MSKKLSELPEITQQKYSERFEVHLLICPRCFRKREKLKSEPLGLCSFCDIKTDLEIFTEWEMKTELREFDSIKLGFLMLHEKILYLENREKRRGHTAHELFLIQKRTLLENLMKGFSSVNHHPTTKSLKEKKNV